MNQAILKGRLGSDPELKYTPKGTAVCRFTLATNESWRDEHGNKKTSTEWHKIVIWRKSAEVAGQYLRKGSEVLVRGKIKTRSWDDDHGVKRYVTEIIADEFEFCGSREEGGNGSGTGQNKQADPDDIPF